MNALTLRWLRRPGYDSRHSHKAERDHLDFVVDGISLYELTRAERLDLVGCLGWGSSEHSREMLLLEEASDVPSGRVPIFVCPECGDIGCGAITVRVERTQDGYRWSGVAYENNYDPTMREESSYTLIGPFHFAAVDYRRALEHSAQAARSSSDK